VGTVTWAGLAAKGKFSPNDEPVVTVVLNAKEGYEFYNPDDSDPLSLATGVGLDAGVIAENGTAEVLFNLGTKLEITVKYDTRREIIKKVSGALGLSVSNGSLPASLTHGETAGGLTLSSTNTAEITSAVFAWTKGVDSNGKIDYTDDSAKLTATITINPDTGYTFKGFNTTSSAAKNPIADTFAIGGKKPTVTFVVGTVTGGVAALTANLAYPAISKAALTTSAVAAGITDISDAPVAFDNIDTKLAFDDTAVTGVSATGSGWTTTASDGTNYNATGSPAYKFVLTAAAGYTFAGTDNAGWESAFEGKLTTGKPKPTVAANLSSETLLTVTVTYVISPATLTAANIVSNLKGFTAKPKAGDPVGDAGTPSIDGAATRYVTILTSPPADVAKWTATGTGGTVTDFGSAGTVTYTFCLAPVTGYTFGAAADFTNVDSALEGSGTGGLKTATFGGGAAPGDVAVTWGSASKITIDVSWTL
jgi:hypothetical protein